MSDALTDDIVSTHLTWQTRFDPPKKGAKLRDFILAASQQNFDRIEAHLLN